MVALINTPLARDPSKGQLRSGVYSIKNSANGRIYIGSALYVKKRLSCHKRWLRNGCHKNQNLQGDWNIFGEEAFVFSVILKCFPGWMRCMEIFHTRKSIASNGCYNIDMHVVPYPRKGCPAPKVKIPKIKKEPKPKRVKFKKGKFPRTPEQLKVMTDRINSPEFKKKRMASLITRGVKIGTANPETLKRVMARNRTIFKMRQRENLIRELVSKKESDE